MSVFLLFVVFCDGWKWIMEEIGKADRGCYDVCNDVIAENRESPCLFLTEHGFVMQAG